ncbi:MarR family winged helix-turn-helix transcriptional regulator [Capnocytophaga stomatis]|uniref:HTH-type transcriptional regulator SarZ n=1 Tax=Capnocytophaga stomatis TaxID=1848904 RepID=A0A250G0E3_9FLAO|nr:MarR family transcriptional regulator [Capnocytophaga stomatis]ATA89706.1 MarR family transcriptional regulator [Capnocytophaga stomatis]GIJ94681.1 transcriptional regulator [Capnocytophaga stomatis]GIJ97409.1 transcriptional regulator [Capnocytophaga stomatis]
MNNIFQLTTENSSGLLLLQVTNLWQREIKKILQPFDLTHPQFMILASIYWFSLKKEEITQVLLSNFTQIDPMTTSQIVRNLEKKTFIIRKEHQTDTRAKIVKMTDKGEDCIKKAIFEVEEFDKRFFAKLNGKQSDFNQILQQLLI